jgi:adenylylsulfate kinase-like enzyme
VKGLYAQARNGEIPNFTGISSPYEAPDNPDLTIDTDKFTISEAADQIMDLILSKL